MDPLKYLLTIDIERFEFLKSLPFSLSIKLNSLGISVLISSHKLNFLKFSI